jgi:hypothetical protein
MGAYGSTPTFMSSLSRKPVKLEPAQRLKARDEAIAEADKIRGEWDAIASGANAELKALCATEKNLVGRFHLSINPATNAVTIPLARKRLDDTKRVLTAAGRFRFKRALLSAVPERAPTEGIDNPAPEKGVTASDLQQEVARLLTKRTGTTVTPQSIQIMNRKQ